MWELSKASLIEEQTPATSVTKTNIAIDPLWTPAGFIGSPILSSIWTTDDPASSSLIVDYKDPTPSWSGITIILWLRIDKDEISAKNINILVSIDARSSLLVHRYNIITLEISLIWNSLKVDKL